MIITVIAILAVYLYKTKPQSKTFLKIDNKVTVEVSLADTNKKRAQGYSNHDPVGFDEGMLFVFENPEIYPFWMKDMLFDLDFVFVRDNRVVYLLKNIKAPINNQGEIEYAVSKEPFDSLLEVKAGFIDKFGIEINDEIIY